MKYNILMIGYYNIKQYIVINWTVLDNNIVTEDYNVFY